MTDVYYMYTCIDKTRQIVLEQGSIDTYYYYTYACKGVFNPNIPIFPPNSAEGLHFSAFHSYRSSSSAVAESGHT